MKSKKPTRPRLAIAQILAWADAHFRRTGRWPTPKSGSILAAHAETWRAVDQALRCGFRGLGPGSSLAKLLAQARRKRNQGALPRLTREQILAWADTHFRRTGQWPTQTSGSIVGAREETWVAVDQALRAGGRGLGPGSSLAKLLAQAGRKRNRRAPPRLTEEQIKGWAEAQARRTQKWPHADSGQVAEAPEENWKAIDQALRQGHRGLPGGTTLARLLRKHRYLLLIRDYVPIRAPWARDEKR